MTGHTGPVEPAAPWRGPYPLPLVDEQRLLAANADAADYYRRQLLSPAGAGRGATCTSAASSWS